MVDEIDPRLARLLPIRCLLAKSPGANRPKALVELSFNMDWSDRWALIYWSGTAYSALGSVELDADEDVASIRDYYMNKHPDWEFTVVDPLAEDSPIKIEVDTWLKAQSSGNKFGARNAPYELREVTNEEN